MILDLAETRATTVLEAIKTIVSAGASEPTRIDLENLKAVGEIALGLGRVEPSALVDCSPAELVSAIGRGEDALVVVRVLAVSSIIGGLIDPARMDRLRSFARALEAEEEYLDILDDAAAGRLGEATDRLTKRSEETFLRYSGNDASQDPDGELMPFGEGNEDRRLEIRYRELGELPVGTFGRAFFDHFVSNGLSFPGNEAGQIEGFALTHDTCHLLSGYPTDEAGEILVAAFIGGMHTRKPMESQVLPAIFSWHLGIRMNWLVGRHEGALDPWTFWDAWDRGAATRFDVFDPDWDFWAATRLDLEELRREFHVPSARVLEPGFSNTVR